jgi:signal transduction histidine kinase
VKSALLTLEIRDEHDVMLARGRARQTAELLGFDRQDQTRIATSASELARNVFQYAGKGKAEFAVERMPEGWFFTIALIDQGPGIASSLSAPDKNDAVKPGMGLGMIGARRLMDRFNIDSRPGAGTSVHIGKRLPGGLDPEGMKALSSRVASALAASGPQNPLGDLRAQNQELLFMLEEVQQRRSELAQLNQELEETNRGVVALYAELDERADSLKRVSEMKTQFLSNMTHEFRTPLNSILSLSQMLLDRLDGDLGDEQEKQVNFIQAAAKSLSELVNDLLDLAKVEAGKVKMRVTHFSAASLFGALRGMLKPLADANPHVALVFEEPPVMPLLETDESKLSQILRNFISNGLKFTGSGEVRVKAEWRERDEEVTFSVRDTGIGIAPEDQEKVFEEFVQIEGTHQKKTQGTGLGLPLSRKLAFLLGGSVALESEADKGSVFSVTIPFRYQGLQIASLDARNDDALPDFSHLHALLIDDQEADRYVMRKRLASFRLRISETGSGAEGLARIETHQPDLIFLDLSMPDASGHTVIKQLKANEAMRAIPVVIHTSKQVTPEERELLLRDAAIFLPKGQAGWEEGQARILDLLQRLDRGMK